MNRKEVIEYCLELPGTFEDYPFKDDMESVTIKHKETNKWFALIMNVNGKEYLNVKTEPTYSELLRNSYEYIIPAYHMNKEHWNTIILDDTVDKEIVKELINQSYDLTNIQKNKRSKK